ncbi:MAG: DUF2442 domain-containing protein [Spartobacteria bacterium]|nr:DUF2442 domain-containing protein [Spartobacteria bacterium]
MNSPFSSLSLDLRSCVKAGSWFKKRFDMSPLLKKRPFDRLQAPCLFKQATVNYGTVVWPGNIDIAPETLWDQSIPLA